LVPTWADYGLGRDPVLAWILHYASTSQARSVGQRRYASTNAPTTVMLLELIATLCTSLFAGAAIYVNLLEHPARLETGISAAVKQWRPSYRRATVMQASLAIVGLLAALGAWAQGRGTPVLVGGLLLGSVVPFTLIVIFPTNRGLADPNLDE